MSGTSAPVKVLNCATRHGVAGQGFWKLYVGPFVPLGEDREVLAVADVDGALDVDGAILNNALKVSGALHKAFVRTDGAPPPA